VEKVLKPLRLDKRALFLLDSLHGDNVTLSRIEEWEGRGARYIVGANKLTKTEATLCELSEYAWVDAGANKTMGCRLGVCVCWLQRDGWGKNAHW